LNRRTLEAALEDAAITPAPIATKTRKRRKTPVPATFPPTARSLKPGQPLMEACVEGNEEARAIRDAWAFRFPVTQSRVRLGHDTQVIFPSDQRTSVGGGR
jgi:hypothetical protein